MEARVSRVVVVGCVLLASWAGGGAAAAPLGPGFTYQGQLQLSDMPVSGLCDLQFSLWDAIGSGDPPTGGTQIGATQTLSPLSVTDGLFTTQLNGGSEFGPNAFSGDDRWLQLAVRCPAGTGSYTTLSPRQKLTAAPYALYAPAAGRATDVACTGCVNGDDLASGAVTSTQIADGTIQQSHLAFTPGTVVSITAGSGLTGGTITTSGMFSVDFGSASGTVAAGNHNHLRQSWFGNMPGESGLYVSNSSSQAYSAAVVGEQSSTPMLVTGVGGGAGILATTPPAGVVGWSSDGNGVYGFTANLNGAGVAGGAGAGDGVHGSTNSGTGVKGITLTGQDGVYGESQRTELVAVGVHGVANGTIVSAGVFGESTIGGGVYGKSTSGPGVTGSSMSGSAILAFNNGSARDLATIRAANTNTTNGMVAYLTNQSTFATAHLANAGNGQVLWLQNGGTDVSGSAGGDFITCVNNPTNDTQFRILSSGEARSDVGFSAAGADFAEMLPAVAGLEPGDVLAVGADGHLTRTTVAEQTSVVGVYSTNPGFAGGMPIDGDAPGTIPLAVVGVVPVKVSAENGAIHAGDLLVASATPGHAMGAGPHPAVGTVLGKSLGQLASGTGVIRVVVTLQ